MGIRRGMNDDQEQVHDQGTRAVPSEQVANAAAESLHGSKAAEERYEQPDARELPGGNTLIADTTSDDRRE